MSSNKDLIRINIWKYTISDGGVEEWDHVSNDMFNVVDDDTIQLMSNVSIEISYFNKDTKETYKESMIIPSGWIFDGASIPKVFWDVIGKPTSEKFLVPAMVHDWLYGIRFNRELSDEIFKSLLEDSDVPKVKTALMWSAVRIFGHIFYASDTSDFYKSIRNHL